MVLYGIAFVWFWISSFPKLVVNKSSLPGFEWVAPICCGANLPACRLSESVKGIRVRGAVKGTMKCVMPVLPPWRVL